MSTVNLGRKGKGQRMKTPGFLVETENKREKRKTIKKFSGKS
jgi:hypothetical protein